MLQKINFMKVIGFTLIFCFFIAGFLYAQKQVSIGASKDNTLYENATGGTSNGAGEYFFVGKTASGSIRRGLIAFDISGNIPTGAVIDSVKLKLNMSKTSAGPQNIKLHKVLADWGQGTSNAANNEGSGASATVGDATWIHTFFNTNLWTNAGGDFSNTVSAVQSVNNVGFYTWSTSQMVSDVKSWLDNPSTNFGWILIGNESEPTTAKRFDSRENSIQENRPILTVFYKTTTNINHKNKLSVEFSLLQSYPNPFNLSNVIKYSLAKDGNVKLEIYSTDGKLIKTLINQNQKSGAYTIMWNGINSYGEKIASGIYFYQLKVNGKIIGIKKIVFVK
jgi:hypothetical protein